jgi:hypothetical protein
MPVAVVMEFLRKKLKITNYKGKHRDSYKRTYLSAEYTSVHACTHLVRFISGYRKQNRRLD